ncbi:MULTISPECIES: hypothetical protein [unclassified Streptomyces]|uniref:hypothetical protein n=1 Tax=unclassified Streptomyces TaxID=2593676 RepID=UPI00114CDB57|nr:MULTISPECIES: hypothetical protein [unclassified Streptomyces]MYQ87621.1 hypothetical protein [Streptomyces sp. SID4936]
MTGSDGKVTSADRLCDVSAAGAPGSEMQVVQGFVQISMRAWPKLRLMEDTHRQSMSKTVKNRPVIWVVASDQDRVKARQALARRAFLTA